MNYLEINVENTNINVWIEILFLGYFEINRKWNDGYVLNLDYYTNALKGFIIYQQK